MRSRLLFPSFAVAAAALLAPLSTARAEEPAPPAPPPAAEPPRPTEDAAPGGRGDAGASAGPPAPPDAPAAAAREPLEVRVIGGRPDSLQRVPGSGTVITAQDIKRAQPADVAEMLRRVPGLQVREEYGGGLRLDVGVRGLDSGRSRNVLMLEDGVPIAINPYAEADMYYAPPVERMRGMEVVKGSGSILFGPQTVGGVINFLTLAPAPREHAAVDVEGGQLGYARALAQYGNTLGSARYVTQALFRRGDGPRGEGFEQTDVFGKIAFDTSSKGEATLKLGFHDDSAYSDDIGLTRAMYEQNPRQSTLAPSDRMHLRRYEASLIQEQRWSPDTKLRTLAYAYSLTRLWRRQIFQRTPYDASKGFDTFAGDPNLPGGGIYFQNSDAILDRTYEVAGIEPKLEHRARTGDVGHTFDLGARLLGETAHYQQRTGSLADSDSGSNDSEEKHRTLAVAGYLQDRIAFRDWLLVTPGVRVEHAEFHRIVLRQTGVDVQGNPTASDVNIPGHSTVDGVIPGIGIILGARDAHVFAGLHEGWAPPRFADSFNPKGAVTQTAAEASLDWELGSRVFFRKWLRAEATGFVMRYSNQVVAGGAADGPTQINGGATEHFGVEAGGTAMIGRALRWSSIVDLGARYTFARATFVGGLYDGNLVPYAPLHSFNANLDVEQPMPRGSGLGGQIAYAHVSSQFADPSNTVLPDATGQYGLIPAHDIVDVTAHYRHHPTGLTFRFTVKNALDDVYISARRPQGIFVSGFRQILLGARWDWEAGDETERHE